jgi:alpha-tubulin suppressor-like RCC1 family protein
MPAVVACGSSHTASISRRGELFTFGLASSGELGHAAWIHDIGMAVDYYRHEHHGMALDSAMAATATPKFTPHKVLNDWKPHD